MSYSVTLTLSVCCSVDGGRLGVYVPGELPLPLPHDLGAAAPNLPVRR